MRRTLPLLFSLFLLGFTLSFALCSLGASLLCDRFSTQEIQRNIASPYRWNIANLDYPKELFQQPYHYLGKGSQMYVFASEDGRYVLKFFRQNRFKSPPFIVGPRFLQQIFAKKKREKQKKQWELFESCFIAYSELKEECGLLFLQLNPNPRLKEEIILYDALGRPSILPLGELCFVAQKKAEPLMQRLAESDKRASIEKITYLLKRRFSKGIDDHDPVLQKNSGFVGDQAIFLDIGAFYHNPKTKTDPYEQAYRLTRKLAKWLEEKETGSSRLVDATLKQVDFHNSTPETTS